MPEHEYVQHVYPCS